VQGDDCRSSAGGGGVGVELVVGRRRSIISFSVDHQDCGGGPGEKTTTKIKMAWSMEAVMLPSSMVLVQAFTMGALLLSKLALNVGMEPFVLLAYRNLIGAIVVAPFALYFERYLCLPSSTHAQLLMHCSMIDVCNNNL
jgi:hypothetical protein